MLIERIVALSIVIFTVAAVPIPASSSTIAGPGILLETQGKKETEYCFFNNIANGNGEAIPKFDSPDRCITLAPGSSLFVPLPVSFKGRVQRGRLLPATWAEFQLAASDNAAHGDISVEQGMDGCATIASTDGSKSLGGFTYDVLSDAPAAATSIRSDGQEVIASTVGNWLAPANPQAINFMKSRLDDSKTYIVGGYGVADVASKNRVLRVTFC